MLTPSRCTYTDVVAISTNFVTHHFTASNKNLVFRRAMSSANTSVHNTGTSSRRAKDLFGDCALVEIIHLHDCFRGALSALEADVSELCKEISIATSGNDETAIVTSSSSSDEECRILDLERRVAGRFTVIWSVFRAHSSAEDEFIWPALKAKQVDTPNSCGCDFDSSFEVEEARPGGGGVMDGNIELPPPQPQQHQQEQHRERAHSVTVHCIEQEEYEEDHADEEKMFNSINEMLSKLREELTKRRNTLQKDGKKNGVETDSANNASLRKAAELLLEGTGNLMHHLIAHLDKEETHCMPLVAQYLTKTEINDLVGKIMGKRSSELMSQILTMAVQNLNDQDRDDMVKYMKQAMVGTFFERWLKMAGLGESEDGGGKMPPKKKMKQKEEEEEEIEDSKPSSIAVSSELKSPQLSHGSSAQPVASATSISAPVEQSGGEANGKTEETYTSAGELEKLIRAIGTNPNLDTKQKNLTIQGLRDSVWKSNCRLSKRKREEEIGALGGFSEYFPGQAAPSTAPNVAAAAARHQPEAVVQATQQTHHMSFSMSSAGGSARLRRETPPSSYYKKSPEFSALQEYKSNHKSN